MLDFDSAKFVSFLIEWCLLIRPYSLYLLVGGALVLMPLMRVGFDGLRERSGGPLGEVIFGLGLGLQALTAAAWWGPALLR